MTARWAYYDGDMKFSNSNKDDLYVLDVLSELLDGSDGSGGGAVPDMFLKSETSDFLHPLEVSISNGRLVCMSLQSILDMLSKMKTVPDQFIDGYSPSGTHGKGNPVIVAKGECDCLEGDIIDGKIIVRKLLLTNVYIPRSTSLFAPGLDVTWTIGRPVNKYRIKKANELKLSFVHTRDGKLYETHGLAEKGVGGKWMSGVDPMDLVFRIGSITKPIVSATILSLVDAGIVKLDDPIIKYFDPSNSEGGRDVLAGERTTLLDANQMIFHVSNDKRWKDITVRMLLDHSSGLHIYHYDITSDPGAKYSYSNTGYALLKYVINADAKGKGWFSVVKRRILDPLGMNKTYDQTFSGEMVRGYMSFNGRLLDKPVDMWYGQTDPKDQGFPTTLSMLSCASDLNKFCAGLKGILSKESYQAFTNPSKPKHPCTLGLDIHSHESGMIFKCGSFPGFGCVVSIHKDDPTKNDVFITNVHNMENYIHGIKISVNHIDDKKLHYYHSDIYKTIHTQRVLGEGAKMSEGMGNMLACVYVLKAVYEGRLKMTDDIGKIAGNKDYSMVTISNLLNDDVILLPNSKRKYPNKLDHPGWVNDSKSIFLRDKFLTKDEQLECKKPRNLLEIIELLTSLKDILPPDAYSYLMDPPFDRFRCGIRRTINHFTCGRYDDFMIKISTDLKTVNATGY